MMWAPPCRACALIAIRALRCAASRESGVSFFSESVPTLKAGARGFSSAASSETTKRPSSAKRRPLRRSASARFCAPASPTSEARWRFFCGGRTVSTEWAASADIKSNGTSFSSWIQVEASPASRLRLLRSLAPRRPPPSPSPSEAASQASSKDCTASCAMTAEVGGSEGACAVAAAVPRVRFRRPDGSTPASTSASSSAWKASQLAFGSSSASPISASSPSCSSSSLPPSGFCRTVLGRPWRATCRCTYASRGTCPFGKAAASTSAGSTFTSRSMIERTSSLAEAKCLLSKSRRICGRAFSICSLEVTKTTTLVNFSAARQTWASLSSKSSNTTGMRRSCRALDMMQLCSYIVRLKASTADALECRVRPARPAEISDTISACKSWCIAVVTAMCMQSRAASRTVVPGSRRCIMTSGKSVCRHCRNSWRTAGSWSRDASRSCMSSSKAWMAWSRAFTAGGPHVCRESRSMVQRPRILLASPILPAASCSMTAVTAR
mmetsp:Transcript_48861/g.156244  ORF Transcript_48861/g.156244 Transcript_48861/m.156244 type:complete len:496 (-) Transcript_48861:711-2198(-)